MIVEEAKKFSLTVLDIPKKAIGKPVFSCRYVKICYLVSLFFICLNSHTEVCATSI